MVIDMKEITKIVILKEKEYFIGLMEIDIKEIVKVIKEMEKE